MKVLKNYKTKKESIEEFPFIKILEQEDVYVDTPICAVDFNRDYKNPVLYGNYNGVPTVYEETEVREQLTKLKLFYFAEENGKLTEVEPQHAKIKVRLPKETIVDQLIYDNGQIIWAKPVIEKEVNEGAEKHGNN